MGEIHNQDVSVVKIERGVRDAGVGSHYNSIKVDYSFLGHCWNGQL